MLKLLGAGHHAANVVDAASVVGSDGIGVGTVGVRVGGVGDGRGGDGYRGNDGLLMNVGNGNVAGGVMNIRLSSGGGVVSNITSGIVNVGKSSRGVVKSDIDGGIVDVGERGG